MIRLSELLYEIQQLRKEVKTLKDEHTALATALAIMMNLLKGGIKISMAKPPGMSGQKKIVVPGSNVKIQPR